MVLEDGGGIVPAAITCVSLALADAGVDMYNLVASCEVGRVLSTGSGSGGGQKGPSETHRGGPNRAGNGSADVGTYSMERSGHGEQEIGREQKSKERTAATTRRETHLITGPKDMAMMGDKHVGTMIVAYMPVLRQITMVTQSGQLELEEALEMIDMCIDGSSQLYNMMKKCLLEKKGLNK